MNSPRRRILLDSFKVFDLMLVIVSYFASALTIFPWLGPTSLEEFFAMRFSVKNFLLFSAVMIAWHCFFYCFGLYSSKRLATRLSEILDILKATSVGSLVILVAGLV